MFCSSSACSKDILIIAHAFIRTSLACSDHQTTSFKMSPVAILFRKAISEALKSLWESEEAHRSKGFLKN